MQVARLGGDLRPDGRDAVAVSAKLHDPRPWVIAVQKTHGFIRRQAEPTQRGADAGALRGAAVAGQRGQDLGQDLAFGFRRGGHTAPNPNVAADRANIAALICWYPVR